MRVLLLGSGGRESAIASALSRSKSVSDVVAAPGNPGIARVAELEPGVDPAATHEVLSLADRVRPDLVVVGPEAPLVAGVGDELRGRGIAVFGPDAAAARLEGSKAYAKDVMDAAGVATARWKRFSDAEVAERFLDDVGPPYVVKADGLAAGKGVVVTEQRSEAVAAVRSFLVEGSLGVAGKTLVIEEFLDGQEVSLIAFCDGKSVVPCPPAQDYKRVFDGDGGPNTGGMGSYSPVPACPPDVAAAIAAEVLEPVVAACAERGTPFVGALYAGLVLSPDGPKVLEFNARFGDPETQALLPRLESDFAELCLRSATADLAGASIEWSQRAAVAVVLASRGYPGEFASGFPIAGLEEAGAMEDVQVFHAGTAQRDGTIVTSGGRVLAVSALGENFAAARERAYRAADAIEFEGKHVRRDIALRAVKDERGTS